jgi:hypothetical protein
VDDNATNTANITASIGVLCLASRCMLPKNYVIGGIYEMGIFVPMIFLS